MSLAVQHLQVSAFHLSYQSCIVLGRLSSLACLNIAQSLLHFCSFPDEQVDRNHATMHLHAISRTTGSDTVQCEQYLLNFRRNKRGESVTREVIGWDLLAIRGFRDLLIMSSTQQNFCRWVRLALKHWLETADASDKPIPAVRIANFLTRAALESDYLHSWLTYTVVSSGQ